MAINTVSVAEARSHFSKIGAFVVNTGESVTVFRNSKPWVVISPAALACEAGRGVAKTAADEEYETEMLEGFERSERDIREGRFTSLEEFLAGHHAGSGDRWHG